MATKIKLGIIGMSEGNGHPYSWSAIFNGFDPEEMAKCPFPAIPQYLGHQDFPEDSLHDLGEVSYIWTQDKKVSEHIAKAANIPFVADEMEDMVNNVDAILLARDDAENHYRMALPFLNAGLPVFIDKPLALSEKEAKRIFEAQKFKDQIFTCSSMRYAGELKLTSEEREEIGNIHHVEASVPKKWETYAVHIIEPIIANLPHRGSLRQVVPIEKNHMRMCLIEWENISAFIKVTGKTPCPLKLEYFGEQGFKEKIFTDAFTSFKNTLETFVHVIEKRENNIEREETMEIVRIIEKGRET